MDFEVCVIVDFITIHLQELRENEDLSRVLFEVNIADLNEAAIIVDFSSIQERKSGK